MRRHVLLIAALAALAALAASMTANARVERTRCIKLSATSPLISKIYDTFGRGYIAADFQAVRSRDYARAWFVSATVYYHAKPPRLYPVWATNNLSGGGQLFGADHLSLVVSPGLGRLPHVSVSDDGLLAAAACARRG